MYTTLIQVSADDKHRTTVDPTSPWVGIDHVQLAMPAGQEDVARRFYEGILGLPETPKPPHLAARGGCWFESDVVKIHLGVEADFRPARKAHPALLVRDLPALVAALRDAGARLVDDEPLEGYDRVYVDDPFGDRIELMEAERQRGRPEITASGAARDRSRHPSGPGH